MSRPEKCTLTLECILSDAELKEAGKLLAEAVRKTEEVEGRKESFMSQIKADLAEAQAVVLKQSALVSSEKEFRAVQCDIKWDFKKGTKTITRADTKAVVRVDEISDMERQEELDFQKAEKDKAEAAKGPKPATAKDKAKKKLDDMTSGKNGKHRKGAPSDVVSPT